MAMSAVRVMATCALIGQAVGCAAALCAKYEAAPHDIYLAHLDELRDAVRAEDGFIPASPRTVGELCRATPVTDADGNQLANQEALKDGRDRPHSSFGTTSCGLTLPNGSPVDYRFDTPQAVSAVHVTFNSDLNRETLPGGHVERTRSMRANVLLDSPVMHMPTTLCRAFRLEAETPEGTIVLLSVADNARRAYHIPVNRADITALRLVPLENWGGSGETDVFSFDFT
jgi:hypothetical protein